MIYTKNLGKKLVFYVPLGVTYFTLNKFLKKSALFVPVNGWHLSISSKKEKEKRKGWKNKS